jgi:hypothetical protein
LQCRSCYLLACVQRTRFVRSGATIATKGKQVTPVLSGNTCAVCRLGAFPQWHLQGLKPSGRAALIAACMTSLQAAVECLPPQAQELPADATSDAAVALVLASAAAGYAAATKHESRSLQSETRQSVARLQEACTPGDPSAGTSSRLLCFLPDAQRRSYWLFLAPSSPCARPERSLRVVSVAALSTPPASEVKQPLLTALVSCVQSQWSGLPRG